MRKFLLALFSIIILFISSCMEYKEDIKLNDDFSGIILMEFTFTNILLEGETGKELDKGIEKLKTKAKNYKGIKVLFVRKEPLGSKTRYKVKIQFSSLDKLKQFLNDDNSKKGKKNNNEGLYNFKLVENGDYIKFERVIKMDEDSRIPKSEDEVVIENLTQIILSNYTWSFKITFPYKVIKTNGVLSEDKKSVEWSYDLYTLSNKTIKLEATIEKPSIFRRIINFIKKIF